MTRSHHTSLLSKAAKYGIQACVYLADNKNDEAYRPISEIAEALGIPYHFLKKVMAELAQKGLVLSQRSAKGGVALSRKPEKLVLLDIITAIDGEDLFNQCLLGLPGCGEQKNCAMHAAWAVERNRLKLMFSSTTLSDVSSRVQLKGFRLA